MNNKGFTLVELLAVLIILVSISFVAVGGITSSLTRREEKECNEQKEFAINAAKIYFSQENTNFVLIDTLKSNGYIKDDSKINKLSDRDEISIPASGNEYIYTSTEGSCAS